MFISTRTPGVRDNFRVDSGQGTGPGLLTALPPAAGTVVTPQVRGGRVGDSHSGHHGVCGCYWDMRTRGRSRWTTWTSTWTIGGTIRTHLQVIAPLVHACTMVLSTQLVHSVSLVLADSLIHSLNVVLTTGLVHALILVRST
jgi:hypothetical protein